RRQHAGLGVARLRDPAGARLRHPRRREGAGDPGAAPPPGAVARRRDRGPYPGPHPGRDPRPHGGAAMMRPTPRAVLLFAWGVAPALFLVIFRPELWAWSLYYGALVLLAIAVDAVLAFPVRALRVTTEGPDSLQIGESGALTVTIAPTPYPRPTAFELLCE